MKKILAFAALFVLAVMTTAVHADVINGSFEDPALHYGTWYGQYTSITGWDATTGWIEVQNHVAGSPYAGDQHVELDSYFNSGMEQDIATNAGEVYDFSFAYSPRPGVMSESNNIQVFFNGALLANITGYSTPDTNWTVYHYDVTAAGGLSTISFLASGRSDSLGGYLDDVHFVSKGVSVPEPVSLLLFGAGLAGIGFMKRRTGK